MRPAAVRTFAVCSELAPINPSGTTSSNKQHLWDPNCRKNVIFCSPCRIHARQANCLKTDVAFCWGRARKPPLRQLYLSGWYSFHRPAELHYCTFTNLKDNSAARAQVGTNGCPGHLPSKRCQLENSAYLSQWALQASVIRVQRFRRTRGARLR
jgi:hypothetical protein